METTAVPNRPRRRSQQPRVSVREPGGGGPDAEYDLLTAALIGLAVGAGLTYIMRRGPSGRRPVSPVLSGVALGAGWAGRRAGRAASAGARWAADRGEDLWDRSEDLRDQVSDYVGRAREAIDDAVDSELKDLRRAIKRQRKRLGI
ncbi:MAG TPA: hypothetical protein VL383_18900 [Gemmatimonadaceae bacterium]|jgi:hypothetical protein|nr:hypothetical protein [Gemmatimonadaceae bacterium]